MLPLYGLIILLEALCVLNVQVGVEGLVTPALVALLPPGELLATVVVGGLVGGALLGGEVLPQFLLFVLPLHWDKTYFKLSTLVYLIDVCYLVDLFLTSYGFCYIEFFFYFHIFFLRFPTKTNPSPYLPIALFSIIPLMPTLPAILRNSFRSD